MLEVEDLVIQAKKELVAETTEAKIAEIKVRLKEILAAEKTTAMLKAQYQKRLFEIENEINEIDLKMS